MHTSAHDPGQAQHVARLIHFFETLNPGQLQGLAQVYTADCRFKDPFHEVQGLERIAQVYRRMYEVLLEPRFKLAQVVCEGRNCFMTWDFLFRFKRDPATPQTVHGASHLQFDDEGRICMHRDYWDTAEELYEKLPLVGGLMRWLKKRVMT
ncbi:nuclear transport factor 2 family protein [Caldimonas brevitalea]|uniref:Isomerase n=1 Tax=Caldimonas brevitalea TaxID=413882 RepID=A0A0G3BCF4_9BURK|nr:nuclear transport factor 2 family protein [Caldimonas brevitalea]AKJ26997.1 isomerase [Caldimonas brevitalea]